MWAGHVMAEMVGGVANPRGKMRHYQSTLSVVQRFVDVALVMFGMWLAAFHTASAWTEELIIAGAIGAVVFYLIAEFKEIYRSWRTERMSTEIWRVLEAWLVIAGVFFVAGAIQWNMVSPVAETVAYWFVVTPILLTAWRLAARFILHKARAMGFNTRKLAIAGSGELARHVARTAKDNPWMGLKIVGLFDDDSSKKTKTSMGQSIGTLDALVEKVRDGEIDVVYLALAPGQSERDLENLIRRLSDSTASVYVVQDRRSRTPEAEGGSHQALPNLWRLDALHRTIVNLEGIKIVSVYESPFVGSERFIKRAEDIVVSVIALTLLAIPMLIIAIGVKVTGGPGPIFFKQRRYGLDGKQILVWKFRSMTVCEDGDTVKQAQKNDARITPFGSFLRRTSLDELPQFINVLMGSMSIVGPRPHAVAHNEHYRALIGGYMLRHKVKPGITGWAQVNGWRGETDSVDKMGRRIDYDLDYIRNWSLHFDLLIIFKTAFRGFVQENAY